MAASDRSVADLLQDILRNVQDIVRAEVRLAKTEVWEETTKAKSSALWLGAGTISAVFALLFLLLMIMFALALVMATWAAALIVGAGLAIAAVILLMAGMKRFKKIHPVPERTVESVKENIEWAKQRAK